jgi:hypothetical protein
MMISQYSLLWAFLQHYLLSGFSILQKQVTRGDASVPTPLLVHSRPYGYLDILTIWICWTALKIGLQQV